MDGAHVSLVACVEAFRSRRGARNVVDWCFSKRPGKTRV